LTPTDTSGCNRRVRTGWRDCFPTPSHGGLLGVVAARPLIAVVADDEISDATVLISVYEPDQDHGWTPEAIRAILESDRREEGP
jgi:hypothetical protein